ncbi:MAG: hypothetical protein H5T75_04545, partial [Coriobacteriia bacterium]|nr:hypothetical protein [Coriobacteriia bacterium]
SRGRRASQGTPASPQAVRFTYDDADRLVGYSDASRGVSASYAYDAYGQRVRSVVASGSLVTTTTYAYDGLSLLYATTVRSDGTTESVAYLYDAAGAPVAGIYEGSAAAAPVAFFIATTARGDVAELLDASGAPFALYSYDAYGNPGQVRTAATARISAPLAAAVARANALRYAGYAYDAHSGLCCLSKRYYDPATAQFLTKDPAKADGEESPYQYCAGDPVGKVDPSGEWSAVWSTRFNLTASLRSICDALRRVRDRVTVALLSLGLTQSIAGTIFAAVVLDPIVSKISELPWRRELSRLGYHVYRRLFGDVWLTVTTRLSVTVDYVVMCTVLRVKSSGGVLRPMRGTHRISRRWRRKGAWYVRLS